MNAAGLPPHCATLAVLFGLSVSQCLWQPLLGQHGAVLQPVAGSIQSVHSLLYYAWSGPLNMAN
jgi:hypothetical protein